MLDGSMNSDVRPAAAVPGNSLWAAFVPLLPYMLTVFVGFIAMGMALPVVPRHVHDTLGQGTVMVGFVMGCQYLSSLFGRMWAGGITDERGPKIAALIGLLAACGVGTLYLLSVPFVDRLELQVFGRERRGLSLLRVGQPLRDDERGVGLGLRFLL